MTDKYKIAQEVFEGWLGDFPEVIPKENFHEFLKDKIKPKDPLFEKWCNLFRGVFNDNEKMMFYNRFKKKICRRFNSEKIKSDAIVKKIKEIKERLTKEAEK